MTVSDTDHGSDDCKQANLVVVAHSCPPQVSKRASAEFPFVVGMKANGLRVNHAILSCKPLDMYYM